MGKNGTVTEALVKNVAPGLKNMSVQHIVVGLLPFTPVPFSGPDALIAIGRLAGYSLLAYAIFNKTRPLSYAFMGAAGLSLATSLLAGWGTPTTFPGK